MLKAIGDLFPVSLQVFHYRLAIDDKGEGYDADANNDSCDTMAPNVDTFVVEHKQASNDFFWTVKIDAIAMRDMFIILHVLWGGVIIPIAALLTELYTLSQLMSEAQAPFTFCFF